MSAATIETTPAAIWERVIHAEHDELTSDDARAVLRWKFSDADLERVDSLSAKARAGTLTSVEKKELENYLSIQTALIRLKTKAHLALKHAGLSE